MKKSGGSVSFAAYLQPEDSIRLRLRRGSDLYLRLSLSLVYLWLGIQKLTGAVTAAALLGSFLSFAHSPYVVSAIGIAEILLGAALISRRLLPFAFPVVLFHLVLATPAMFPLNVVLICATVAVYQGQLRRRSIR